MKIDAPDAHLNRREAVDSIVRQVEASPETFRVVNGLAMTKLPGRGDEISILMIPVQNGKAQPQHIISARQSEVNTDGSIFLCAFFTLSLLDKVK